MILCAAAALTAAANHPWLTRVYDFQPAPGQFINTLPTCYEGEPKDSVLARCAANICGYADTTTTTLRGETYTRVDTVWSASMISLGGYGGYVIVGFDHPVVNMHTYDFEIYGNAFVSDVDSRGGSCEPGIVMVGVDADGDGVPSDGDKWYELAGSEYGRSQHNYSITYYRPDENKERTPSATNNYLNDTTYIRWTSNDVNPDSTAGYLSRNVFHSQPYWPYWLADQDSITFTGSKLPCNATDIGGNNGNAYFVQYFFNYGYVDNLPNNTVGAPSVGDDSTSRKLNPGFKIDWAVDEEGNHVTLPQIDFIKIYTGLNQYCGWIGETSTEVAGGIDFHPDAEWTLLTGDVNADGEVNIADVNALISIILGNSTAEDYVGVSDVNGDAEINIADVNAVIAIILGD